MSSVFVLNLLALLEAMVIESLLGLLRLLLQQSLDQHVFFFLLVQQRLGSGLVYHKFSPPSFPFFACEVTLLLCLLDLVNRSRIGEVLDLTRRDAFLLVHLFHGVLHVCVLLNAKLLEVLLELL